MTYLVFGRRSYPEPLEQQGALQAPDAEAARGVVLTRFPGPWVELVLVPAQDASWVLGPETELEGARVGIGVG